MKRMRKSTVVELKKEDDVRRLVSIAERCDFPIDVYPYQSHYAVDGKSLLGVMAICAKGKIEVTFNGESEELECLLCKI